MMIWYTLGCIVGVLMIMLFVFTLGECKKEEKKLITVCVVGILLTIAFISYCIIGVNKLPDVEEYRYSTKDYNIETEIVIRGSQVDTTYIFTKKN